MNLLIRYQEGRLGIRGDGQFLTPVIGSKINGKLPTSVDVHLYADPASYRSDLPILYADSEGLQSGEKTPVGARLGSRSHSSAVPSRHSYRRKKRPISWADNDNTRKREYAVTELYPRILYTFSDVVVFVHTNPKWVLSEYTRGRPAMRLTRLVEHLRAQSY